MTQPPDPYLHRPEINVATVRGAAMHARVKSATANAVTHKFVVVRRLGFRAVARQIKAFPPMAMMSINRSAVDWNATSPELRGGSSIVL